MPRYDIRGRRLSDESNHGLTADEEIAGQNSGLGLNPIKGVTARGNNFRSQTLATYAGRAADLAPQLGPNTVSDGGAEFTRNLLELKSRHAASSSKLLEGQTKFEAELGELRSRAAEAGISMQRDISEKELKANENDFLDTVKEGLVVTQGLGRLARTISGTERQMDREKYEEKYKFLVDDRNASLMESYREAGVDFTEEDIPQLTQKEINTFKDIAAKHASPDRDPQKGVRGVANHFAGFFESAMPSLKKLRRTNEQNAKLQGLVMKGIATKEEVANTKRALETFYSKADKLYSTKVTSNEMDRQLGVLLDAALDLLRKDAYASESVEALRALAEIGVAK